MLYDPKRERLQDYCNVNKLSGGGRAMKSDRSEVALASTSNWW